jgi:hypothetical protein
MIIITKVEALKTEKDIEELEWQIYCEQNSHTKIGDDFVPVEYAREIIRGRRFVNPSRDIDVVIGVTGKVGDLLGLQYEAFENMEKEIEVLRIKNQTLHRKLDSFTNASLWKRLKYSFTGVLE